VKSGEKNVAISKNPRFNSKEEEKAAAEKTEYTHFTQMIHCDAKVLPGIYKM
jgi:hypothetical protein